MKVYLAASYSRRLEMLARAGELEAQGHAVTSRWVDGHHETRPNIDETGSLGERARWATEDLKAIDDSNVFVVCNDAPGGSARGGRHFEAGYAFGQFAFNQGHYLYVIGDRANPFYCTFPWIWVPDWAGFVRDMEILAIREEEGG